MKYLIIALLVIIIIVGVSELALLGFRVSVGKMLARNTKPFSFSPENPNKKILIVGDSTAYGTGTRDTINSTAGYFHQDFPEAEIINISKNGAKTEELTEMIKQAKGSFDLVVLQAGANNIIYFTPLQKSKDTMRTLLKEAKEYSDNVVLLTAGNVGAAPMFMPPLSWLYTYRAKKHLAAFREVASEENVAVVNLWLEAEEDVFSQDPEKYYAKDKLHLTGEGYKLWYEKIRETMKNSNINF